MTTKQQLAIAEDEIAYQRDINQQIGQENERLRQEVAALERLVERVAKLEAEPMWNQRKTVKMWALTGVESVRAILADAQRLAGVDANVTAL